MLKVTERPALSSPCHTDLTLKYSVAFLQALCNLHLYRLCCLTLRLFGTLRTKLEDNIKTYLELAQDRNLWCSLVVTGGVTFTFCCLKQGYLVEV